MRENERGAKLQGKQKLDVQKSSRENLMGTKIWEDKVIESRNKASLLGPELGSVKLAVLTSRALTVLSRALKNCVKSMS